MNIYMALGKGGIEGRPIRNMHSGQIATETPLFLLFWEGDNRDSLSNPRSEAFLSGPETDSYCTLQKECGLV